jgi:hypothetical protein
MLVAQRVKYVSLRVMSVPQNLVTAAQRVTSTYSSAYEFVVKRMNLIVQRATLARSSDSDVWSSLWDIRSAEDDFHSSGSDSMMKRS